MRTSKTFEKFANTVVETTTTIDVNPATVDYRDILESCEVVSDDMHGAPWEEMDGWEHDTESVDCDEQRDARGYSHEIDMVIVPTDSDLKGTYRYYRQCGCSRQTAAEMVALETRKRLDALVNYHDNGWEWYGVKGEYLDREASCWGIDGYDYAHDGVRHEIAGEIASQLEEDGYTVANQPDQAKQERQAKRDRLKRNLMLDCWTD